jgi:hypothetical protein
MRLDDDLLNRLRRVADPLADGAIADLGRTGQARAVGALIPQLVAVPQPDPGALPPEIAGWLEEHARLPAGADRERLERASALWVKRGVTMAMILGTASLAECYAAARGVRAVAFSGRLTNDTLRRLRETVLWVNLIMLPGGLAAEGEGIRAVYKVRLMHAAIRHLLLQSGRWETAELGLPLCQEDMAGTLMTFAYTVPRGLRRLGIRLSPGEAEDYLYFWSVVGEMLGVRPELLPGDMAEAAALTAAVFRRQHAASPEGLALTRSMLETYGRLLPGGVLHHFFPAFIRYLSGDAVADLLGVPSSPWAGGIKHYRLIGSVADFGWRTSCAVRGAARRLASPFPTRT